MVRLFRNVRPDIVHLNSSKAGVIGTYAARIAKIKKIVYTAHGFVFNEPLPSWKKMFYQIAERLSSAYKNAIICVSEFDKKTGLATTIAPESKLITIHNGIAPPTVFPVKEAKNKLGIDETENVVGTIANFYPSKDLPTLIKAFALIAQKNKNIQLVLVGHGEGEHELRQLIKSYDIENQATVVTNTRTDGASILSAFTIFVLPSVKEGLPYTIIEAMMAEVPIVATNVGGVPELIEHKKNGLLVQPRDPQALADTIDQLLNDRALAKQFTLASHSKASMSFNLELMVQKTIVVYQG